ESAVAIDAAPGESRNVSPGPSHYAFAATRGRADFDGPDALLPPALRPRGSVVSRIPSSGNHSNDCMDEGDGAAGARAESHHRAGADDGRAARRPCFPDRKSEKRMFSGHRIDFRQPETVRPERGFCKIPERVRKRHRKAE